MDVLGLFLLLSLTASEENGKTSIQIAVDQITCGALVGKDSDAEGPSRKLRYLSS